MNNWEKKKYLSINLSLDSNLNLYLIIKTIFIINLAKEITN